MTLRCACNPRVGHRSDCLAPDAIRGWVCAPDEALDALAEASALRVRAYAASLRRETRAVGLLVEAAMTLPGTPLATRIWAWLQDVEARERQAQIDQMAFEAGEDDESRRGAQET